MLQNFGNNPRWQKTESLNVINLSKFRVIDGEKWNQAVTAVKFNTNECNSRSNRNRKLLQFNRKTTLYLNYVTISRDLFTMLFTHPVIQQQLCGLRLIKLRMKNEEDYGLSLNCLSLCHSLKQLEFNRCQDLYNDDIQYLCCRSKSITTLSVLHIQIVSYECFHEINELSSLAESTCFPYNNESKTHYQWSTQFG